MEAALHLLVLHPLVLHPLVVLPLLLPFLVLPLEAAVRQRPNQVLHRLVVRPLVLLPLVGLAVHPVLPGMGLSPEDTLLVLHLLGVLLLVAYLPVLHPLGVLLRPLVVVGLLPPRHPLALDVALRPLRLPVP